MKKNWLTLGVVISMMILSSCHINSTSSEYQNSSHESSSSVSSNNSSSSKENSNNSSSSSTTSSKPSSSTTSSEPSSSTESSKPSSSITSSEPSSSTTSSEPSKPVEPKEKVHVIILAGQSNAVGQSFSYHFSEEDLEKYKEGFENVKIRYDINPFSTTETKHANEIFEKVKIGQGKGVDWTKYPDGCIGPELGIAKHLSETYPNEKFYIIKNATGGTTLHDRWYSTSSLDYLNKFELEENSLYTKLLNFVDESMGQLKENYDPEIFSFCWMQGENDAKDYWEDYEVLWSNFISDLKSVWGEKDYLADNGLSVIDAGITNYWTNFDAINGIKEKYAAMSSKNHYIEVVNEPEITAFKDNTDYAHLDVYAMLKLGELFGEKIKLSYEDLVNEEVVYTQPQYENNKWNGVDISSALSGEGTVENPYLISSPADMAYFAENVKVNDYSGKHVKLTCDLDMSNYAFKGIGSGEYTTKYEYTPFAGTFDGDNHKVTVKIVKDFVAGLFAAVTGTVKNVEVAGTVRAVYRAVGGIAGLQEGGKIENCINSAIVTSKYYTPGNGNVGGIVGYQKNGDVTNCTNNGEVYGFVNLITDNQGVGGIIGTVSEGATGTISGNVNNGTVYNKGLCTGGVIGMLRGKILIDGCTNNGTVTGVKSFAGGILGFTNFSDNTISNCTNTAKITANSFVGGIAGTVGYNGDRSTTVVNNCTNSGDIEATGTTFIDNKIEKAGARVGGIAGMAYGSTVKDCTNTGTVTYTGGTASEEYQEAVPYAGLIVGYKTTKAKVSNNTYQQ